MTEYIIHTKTQNMSFLKVYRYLRDKGVKNNKFFLKLYDKDLEKVDPNSKHLTASQKAKVLTEIARNPYYYIREVVLVDIPGGKAKFELHPGNLAIIWCIFNNFDQIVLLPRQRYKTVSIAAALSWVYFFGTTSTHMLFGNKSQRDSLNNLKRFKSIRNNFPDYLKAACLDPKNDRDNQEFVESYKTKNRVDVLGNPTNMESADKMGRGMSIPHWWSDEHAFINFNDVILKSAAPAIRTVSILAEKNGKPHSKIISTTPNNIDSPNGAACFDLIENACTFFEEMYDWEKEKIKSFIEANSSNNFLYIKYTWQQLGLTQEWYETMCRDLLYDWLIIKREVDLHWTKSSDNSAFKEKELDALDEGIIREISTLTIEITKTNNATKEVNKIPYAFKLIRELDKDHCYFIGCDVGGGTGRDYSTIVVTDPQDEFKEVAVFKNNTINLSNYRMLLETLIKDYLPNSTLFIEDNSYGRGVIDELIQDPTMSKRLYYEYNVSDKDKTKSNPATVTNSIKYGINTNTATRTLMIDILREVVIETPHTIVSEDVYDDIKGLIYNKQGKVEHDRTTHDDCVFGKLMVLYAVRYGNNIGKFLRNAESITRTNRRINALTQNNVMHVVVDDPTTNKGINLNFEDISRLLKNGEALEDILKEFTKNMDSPKKKVDMNRMAIMLNKS